MKTFHLTAPQVTRDWHIFDASGQVLGKLATQIATKLMGKHKPTYTAHIDSGDYIVVINASQVAVTGRKAEAKKYYRHSGYSGGLREKTFADLRETNPERIITEAVYNMLPPNRLRRERMRRLKIYSGAEHPHQSQLAKAV